MRITTDIRGLEQVAPEGVEIVSCCEERVPSRATRVRQLLFSALRSDYLILHFQLPEVIFFTAALALWPFTQCRVVTLDFFIGTPRPALLPLVRWSIARIHKLLVYFKGGEVFAEKFGIREARFEFIPFKVNSLEFIQSIEPHDEGYIFSGGRSYRDFATLFEALSNLPYPAKIIAAPEAVLVANGCSLAGLTIPPNVEVITDNPDTKFFNLLLSRSRMVVLPVIKDSTTQAGISVYLQAMALEKCVVISDGLGVSQVLDSGQAVVVPAGDARALHDAISRVWEDSSYRESIAKKGREFAESLGGEDNLKRNILRAVGVAI